MLTRMQVADFLAIKPKSLATMLSDGRMVKPDVGRGATALWNVRTIETWCANRPKRGPVPLDPIERFMEKVLKDAESGCWLWQAHVGAGGYGTFRTSRDVRGPAHRRGYELLVGPVGDDMQLDHLCRVRHCVNPEHLEPVTARENIMRAPATFQARNAAKTHCPQGHPYSEENTRHDCKGSRSCRECGRASWRAWYRKKKEQAAA